MHFLTRAEFNESVLGLTCRRPAHSILAFRSVPKSTSTLLLFSWPAAELLPQAASKGRRSSACVCLFPEPHDPPARALSCPNAPAQPTQPSTIMTHPQPSPPSSVEADQDLLDRLLREAFKPSSPEFESYTHVRPTLPFSTLSHTCVPSRLLN